MRVCVRPSPAWFFHIQWLLDALHRLWSSALSMHMHVFFDQIVAGVARVLGARADVVCVDYLHLQRSGDGRGEFKHDERFGTGTRRDGLWT